MYVSFKKFKMIKYPSMKSVSPVYLFRSSRLEVLCLRRPYHSKFLKDYRTATLLKKRLWHRCFSYAFCEISKKTFYYRTPQVAASVSSNDHSSLDIVRLIQREFHCWEFSSTFLACKSKKFVVMCNVIVIIYLFLTDTKKSCSQKSVKHL